MADREPDEANDATPTKLVQAMVGGDAVEPGVDLSPGLEGRRFPIGLEKDFLGRIAGILRISQQPFAEVNQSLLVTIHEPLEGLHLSGGDPRQHLPVPIHAVG